MPVTHPAFSRALAFGEHTDTYNALRPPVPLDIVRWMVPDPCPLAAELGAGTGLFTRDLANYAVEVIAIDKDHRMRKFLHRNRPSNVTVRPGEAASMPDVRDRSASLVAVSSAWHWFEVPQAAREIARVLHDRGRLSVVWTHRDTDVEWMREICELTDLPHERTPGEFELPRRSPFGAIDHTELKWQRSMRTRNVVDLMDTYSGMLQLQRDNPVEAARVRGQVAAIVRAVESNGFVDVPFRTSAFRTHRKPRAVGAVWAGGQCHTLHQGP